MADGRVRSKDGGLLICNGLFEPASLNVGDYVVTKNVGGRFPIGGGHAERPGRAESLSIAGSRIIFRLHLAPPIAPTRRSTRAAWIRGATPRRSSRMRSRRFLSSLMLAGTLASCRPEATTKGIAMPRDTIHPREAASRPSSPATPVEAPNRDSSMTKNDWLSFALGQDTFYLVKAADRQGQPRSFEGDEEYRRALKRAPNANLVLLHVLVPSPYHGTRFLHRVGDRLDTLPSPQLIYRMPNSALRTFVVVDLDQPGTIEASAKDGTTSALDLHDKTADIESFPHRWSKASPFLTYAHVPVRQGPFMPE